MHGGRDRMYGGWGRGSGASRWQRSRGGPGRQDSGGQRAQVRWGARCGRQRLQLGGAEGHDVARPDWLTPADPLPVEEGSIGGGKILHDQPRAGEVYPGVPAGQRRVAAEAAG